MLIPQDVSIWPEQHRLRPVRKRELVRALIENYRVSECRVCKAIIISRSNYHYQAKGDGQAPLRLWIRVSLLRRYDMAIGKYTYFSDVKDGW